MENWDRFCQSSPSDHPSSSDESEEYNTTPRSSPDLWSYDPDSINDGHLGVYDKNANEIDQNNDGSTLPPTLHDSFSDGGPTPDKRCDGSSSDERPLDGRSFGLHDDIPSPELGNDRVLSRDNGFPEQFKD